MTVSVPAPTGGVDVSALRSLARVLEEHADAVAGHAAHLERAVLATRWESSAAEQARGRVAEVVAQLRSGADRSRRAAAAVRAHLAEVTGPQAQVRVAALTQAMAAGAPA